MAKNKIDEMRDKLRINDLDESGKKQMFNRFVKAGGKVVDMDKKNAQKASGGKQGNKQEPIRQDGESEKRVVRAPRDRRRRSDDEPQAARPVPVPKENSFGLWLEKFITKISCVLAGIFSFNERDFKSAFQEFVLITYQNMLLNSRMILASILYQDKLIANEIKKRFSFDTNFPFYYEVLFRYDNLYSDVLFNGLMVMRNSADSVNEARQFMLEMFKSLYLLQPYAFSLKSAVEKALVFEKEIRRLDPNVSYANIRKLFANIDFIFQKVYPRLFNLVDYYYKRDPANRKVPFKDFLGIQEIDHIGYLTALWKEEMELAARLEEEEKKRLEAEAGVQGAAGADGEGGAPADGAEESDPVKRGFALLEKQIHFRDIRQYFIEKKDIRGIFALNDKVFLTYIILDFFDKEFSFIATANKVVFNVTFNAGNREDLKRELMDLFYKINNIFERSKEYVKILMEVRKIDKDSFMRQDEKTSRFNQLSLQRSQISRAFRKETRELFEEFTKKFLYILNDMKTSRRIIQNQSQVLEFSKKVDGVRYLQGKTMEQSIEDAYYFSSVFSFLLGGGDLGGMTIMLEKPIYLKLDMAGNADGQAEEA